ncbi:MAG: Pycsar system effector family protein [Bacteroidota bacterium]
MKITEEAEKLIESWHRQNPDDHFDYHDLQHTREVVYYSKLIGQEESLTDKELEIVEIAAWFHDTGYMRSTEEHEKHSAELAREFLTGKYPEEDISKIEECIKATKVPQNPQNKTEAVLCDADMAHLSHQESFMQKSEKLRTEWNNLNKIHTDKYTFWVQSLYFMTMHSYKTEYGQKYLAPGKELNIRRAEEEILKNSENHKLTEAKPDKKNKKKKKESFPARGIETMFRITGRNQINLSAIADNKANILISVNSIIISIIVTMLVRKFSEYPNIIVPSMIFLLTSLTTMIFAILSTRPNIKKGRFSAEDVRQKRVNLLFFGNFYNMRLDEYDAAIKEIMKDYDGLYSTMIKDQYYLGKVLGKKYRLLRTAYTIFMFGFTISVLSFAIFAIMVPVP